MTNTTNNTNATTSTKASRSPIFNVSKGALALISNYRIGNEDYSTSLSIINDKIKTANAKCDELRNKRSEYVSQGHTEEEAFNHIPDTNGVFATLDGLKKQKTQLVTDHKNTIASILDNLVPNNLYYAYKLAMVKNSFDATGEVSLSKTEKVRVKKSYNDLMLSFLETTGVKLGTSDGKNLKAVRQLMDLAPVLRLTNAKHGFITTKTKTEFKKAIVHMYMYMLITVKGTVTYNGKKKAYELVKFETLNK